MSMREGRPGPLAPATGGNAVRCRGAECRLVDLNVLLVEADPAEVASTARIIATARCRVRAVSGGRTALQPATTPDLAVLGFDLPDMDGFALLLALRRRRPRLPAVVLAGAGDYGPDLPTLFQDGKTRLLRKPAGGAALLGALAALACPGVEGCRFALAA